jgi:Lrp/AsnC family leucine-responsive transcriptional regulator
MSHDLDPADLKILDLLRGDARRTFGDIAKHVGLSAPAVKRRVDRLEKSGVIRGYTTLVDHAQLGDPLEAFVELRFNGSTRVDDIESIAAADPEVLALFTIAGDPDALAWIRVRDVADLKRIVDRLRANRRITGTKTMIVLGSSLRTLIST